MKINYEDLTVYTKDILSRAGASDTEAQIVAEELVQANLMGVDSHGILRIPQYLWQMEEKFILPDAHVKIIKETPTTAIIDADHGYGHVAGRKTADTVIQKALKSGVACAISVNCTHIGRLGAYTERIARSGLLAFGTAGLYSCGPLAPYGSAEARLGTNPISWAVPRKDKDPVMMDGATTVVAEGKLRTYIQKREPVPEGWIRDGYGHDTTDPNDFYKTPRGTILPLGGKTGGAKGSALAIMADLFSIALADDDYWTCLREGKKLTAENGLFLFAVNPDCFFGRDAFECQVANHADYIKSAKPADGFCEVLLPGEYEFRMAEKRRAQGIDIPDETWSGIVSIAAKMGCHWADRYPDQMALKDFVHY